MKTAKILALLLTIAGIIGGYSVWLLLSWIRPWQEIRKDDDEARVIALLGRPTTITVEHAIINETWQKDDVFAIGGREVVKVFRYNAPPPLPAYSISFDFSGHVVAKGKPPSP